jgi:hypothetical protein
MIIVMRQGASEAEIAGFAARIEAAGLRGSKSAGVERVIIGGPDNR